MRRGGSRWLLAIYFCRHLVCKRQVWRRSSNYFTREDSIRGGILLRCWSHCRVINPVINIYQQEGEGGYQLRRSDPGTFMKRFLKKKKKRLQISCWRGPNQPKMCVFLNRFVPLYRESAVTLPSLHTKHNLQLAALSVCSEEMNISSWQTQPGRKQHRAVLMSTALGCPPPQPLSACTAGEAARKGAQQRLTQDTALFLAHLAMWGMIATWKPITCLDFIISILWPCTVAGRLTRPSFP